MEEKNKYPGGYTESDFTNWITWDEAKRAAIEEEYQRCDKYSENYQAPETRPANVTFIEENLVTDLISGYTGQLVGARTDLEINGGGAYGEVLKELAEDIIFRANRFMESKMEPLGWRFYKNGIGGISIQYNPFKKSQYGIGVPEIHILRWQDILLDANSRGGMHEDDTRRGIVKRVTIDYAKKKYPHLKDKIKPMEDGNAGEESDKFCNIYNYEYCITEFITDPITSILIEKDVYYMFKMINSDVLAEEPEQTGFSQFMLVIPAIHTGREETYQWPFGAVLPVLQTQNEINVVKSVMLEAVKASIKNLLLILNAKGADEARIRREAAKPNGVVVLEGNNVQVHKPNKNEIATALIQWYEYLRRAFDEITGRYAPERGAVEGDLSGKAIALLNNRGAVPEMVRRLHIENALSSMTMGIAECICKKMHTQPFKITKQIDGNKQDIYFNYPVEMLPMQPDFQTPFVNASEEGGLAIINDLRKVDLDSVDLKVKVQLNVLGSEVDEGNKAIIARQNGALSLKDFVKKLYPDEWKQIYENKMKEDQILGLFNEIIEIEKADPQAGGELLQKMSGIVQLGKDILQQTQLNKTS